MEPSDRGNLLALATAAGHLPSDQGGDSDIGGSQAQELDRNLDVLGRCAGAD